MKPLHPPVEDLLKGFHRGSVIFKWIGEQPYLKVMHPLCNTLVTSTTEGVRMSHGSVQCANLFDINTLSMEGLQ